MTFRMSTRELESFLEKKTLNGTHQYYQVNNQQMHYAMAGDERKPLVVFVHGSPGSLSAFIDFLADTVLTKNALTVTVDRPGFGHSDFGWGERSLKKQAQSIKPILEKFENNRPIILVGHSLGGAVIGKMAIDYPQLVDGLILVAASIDPELEPNEVWFRAPLATPFLSWAVPPSFRASNEEIYHLKPQLESMRTEWQEIRCPVRVIQGEKDKLVPPGNAAYAQLVIVNAPIEIQLLKGVNHFIPWNNPHLIQYAILDMLQHKSVKLTEK